jgi:hypothetical protein
MKYFVLFSMLLIVASVTILMMPQTEGFTPAPASITDDDDVMMYRNLKHPAPADHRNTSSTAGAADGTSDHQYLLDGLLAKHDRLAESFENKVNPVVSATTTQKKSIASTSSEAFTGMAGSKCNPKCVPINNTSDAIGGKIGGNCVNPKLPDNNPDYSKKYCPAFRPPDGDPLMREQECATCGYYKYAANCIKHADLQNPDKCTLYGSYNYEHPTTGSNNYMKCNDNDPICNLFYGVGNNDGGDGTTSNTGPTCSVANCAPKQVTVTGNKCFIPGCISADGGILPYPKDFYGTDMINPCIGKGANGIKCPAISTVGTMYDSAGGSNDPCYTTNSVIDPNKFQSMNQVPICNRVKPISLISSSGALGQGQGTQTGAQGTQTGAQGTQTGAQGTQTGAQASDQGQGQGTQTGAQGHDRRSKKRGSSSSSTYVDPVPGTLYLGIF